MVRFIHFFFYYMDFFSQLFSEGIVEKQNVFHGMDQIVREMSFVREFILHFPSNWFD